jgi:GLPGLI family protein
MRPPLQAPKLHAKALLLTLALVATLTATAQINIGNMVPKAGGGQNVSVEDDKSPFVPNSFIGSFRMENHLFKNGKEEKNSPTTLRYWSSAEMTLMKTELPDNKGQDMKMLTDLIGKWQYMLMTDDKGRRTAMKSRKKNIVVKDDGKHPEPEVKVTDETKVIDGHTCVKVVSTSTDGTWTGWVAKDLPAPFGDMLRNVKTGDPGMSKRMSELQGFPLEFEWVDANGKDTMHCYIKDVVVGTVDESVFSLDGYEVTEMPSFGQ